MKCILPYLAEVEPLVSVASLIIAAGVFIYTLVTIEEIGPFPQRAIVSNRFARLFCIPLPVAATLIALFYVCVPSQQWLTFFSFGLIVFDLLVVLAFCITVLPLLEKKQKPWSIEYLLPRFKKAQSTDLEEIKKLASE